VPQLLLVFADLLIEDITEQVNRSIHILMRGITVDSLAGSKVDCRFGNFQVVLRTQRHLSTGDILRIQPAEFVLNIAVNRLTDIQMFAGDVVVHHPLLLLLWVKICD